jgi:serine protease Do
VITNAHVVAGAERVQVLLAYRVDDGGPGQSILRPRAKLREAEIVGIDPETDLAVIKVDGEQEMPYLEFGDSDELRQGQLVFAFGSPLGLENSFTMGVVSSVARQLEPEGSMIYIQTDTAINPGNSGGPLLDAQGRIMGINTLIFSQSGGNEGIGFAAPSNIVRTVYQQIRESGVVRRGEIGIHAQTITPILAEGLGLSQDWGAILADVAPGGPGAIAGLQAGDVVLTMDEKIIENGRQLLVNLYQRKIGDVVRLEVLRGKEKLNIRVAVLEEANDPARLLRLVTRDENLVEQLGVLALALDRNIRSMLPPLRKSAGVVVAARVAEGPYWNALLQPGDVIYAVNTTPTPGLQDLRDALDTLAAGDAIVIQFERLGRMQYVTFLWE